MATDELTLSTGPKETIGFKVTVERITKGTKMVQGNYTNLATVFWTQKEVDDADESIRGRFRSNETSEDKLTKTVMGYPPKREVESREIEMVFQQVVDVLDLSVVVLAINTKKAV